MKPAEVVDPVVDAAKHPLRAAAWTYGVLRGLAASVIRVAAGKRGPVIPGYLPGPVAAPVEENVAPEDVVHLELVEPAPEREPEPPGESFATEPTAVSRVSAHGGGGQDAEIDEWYGEGEGEDALPNGVVEALEMNDGTGPLVDESAIKATLSEAEILRRSADNDR
jgi:hypothetical protein